MMIQNRHEERPDPRGVTVDELIALARQNNIRVAGRGKLFCISAPGWEGAYENTQAGVDAAYKMIMRRAERKRERER